MAGMLYLCATPIGNLEDITLRVLETLKDVDLIAAEDTRHSRILMERFDIHTPLTSYHEHNKFEKAEILVAKMQEGLRVALVTDAGTPAISDPGEELVHQCYAAGIPVTSLPGPSAVITALTLSGMSTRRFCFEAFLPSDKKERRQVLEELQVETRTTVFYEAPHRLRKTLEELQDTLGDRRLTLCRELTKRFEEVMCTTIPKAVEYFLTQEPRGEYVLVLEGRSQKELAEEKAQVWEEMTLTAHLAYYQGQGLDKKEAMKRMAKDRNCSRRDIYRMLLEADREETES